MAKDRKPDVTDEAQESLNTTIRDALRRGMMDQTGEDGARRRLVGKSVGGPSILKRGLGGLLGSVSSRDIFTFCEELALLVECGMPLVRALNTVAQRVENYTLACNIMDIARRIEEGSTFTEAASAHSGHFPAIVINMFHAGEQSGNLVGALYRVAEHGEHLISARHKALATLIYPAILAFALVGIMFVFGHTMGELGPFIQDMKVEVPRSMRIMLAGGKLIKTQRFWWGVGAAISALLALFVACRSIQTVRLLRDRLLLRLPILRHYIKIKLVGDFARIFSIMIESGVSLDVALQAAHETTANEVLRLTIERARREVSEGGRMTPALERGGVFPAIAYDLCAVGEEAGALGRVFRRMADAYEDRFATDIAIIGKTIQPVIIIVMALIVGYVIFGFLSMFMAMYSSVPAAGS